MPESFEAQVWENSSNGQRLITVPSDVHDEIQDGDTVKVFHPPEWARKKYIDEYLISKLKEVLRGDD